MHIIIAAILALLITTTSFSQTLIIPVADLLMEIPEFRNSPQFNLNTGMMGQLPVGNSTKEERVQKRQLETQLIQFMWVEYPDAKSITIWNKNLIIKL
jgi:hypothetical protein